MDYKDKLRLAKEALDSGSYDKETIEYIFPELAESEDEKIRKEIIELVMQPTWKTEKEFHRRNELCVWLEKQAEQKPDKIEPKFKVGDWVTDVVSKCQICFIDDTQYWYSKNCILGNIESIDKRYHLWTIEDAKDGDVLVASDGSIFLFKDRVYSACKYYIALTTDGAVKFNNDGLEHYWETVTAVHPATKEQRDLLFQKMKEAGYEWDAEKKELKKIEQKPAEWSEEDEKILSDIIKDLVHPWNEYIPDRIENEIKWLKNKLKSLRPQNTWKPSDEQMEALLYEVYAWDEDSINGQNLKSLYQDLKKLREE